MDIYNSDGKVTVAIKASPLWENTSMSQFTMRRDGEVRLCKDRSALRVQRRWLQFSDEEWDKELESIRTLNDADSPVYES